MNGNLTIGRGGTVSITDGELSSLTSTSILILSTRSSDHAYSLVIEDGGKLILNNAMITTGVQLNTIPTLGMIIRNGGQLVATNSTLAFPGHLTRLDDASMTLNQSAITGISKKAGDLHEPDLFP